MYFPIVYIMSEITHPLPELQYDFVSFPIGTNHWSPEFSIYYVHCVKIDC